MKILLFGKNGQVGWELQRSLAPLGELVMLDFDSPELHGDFSQPKRLAETVRAVRPDVIVNAAAHTAVDKAESEPDLARRINAIAPGVLAREAEAYGAWLLHYSTDYVFDGSGDRPWRETDPTGPLSVYGRTKLEGEQVIRASGCKHLILRTSWVYAARGGNFAKTMLRLAAERETLRVVADQIGAPTGADLLADVSAHCLRAAMARPELVGTYHCVAAGEASWYHYACMVIEHARASGRQLAVRDIEPVATRTYPAPAARPLNSRLCTEKISDRFGLAMPHWSIGIKRMLEESLG